MRVVAGTRRGRRFAAPTGRGTRPTSDRVREALFSSLAEAIPGARVLDLYAGSGALGIEALSRGAAAVTFVEHDRRASAVIRRNLEVLDLDVGVGGGVLQHSCAAFCAEPTGGPFSLVLADPPYAVPLRSVFDQVADLWTAAALDPSARVAVERSRRDPALASSGEPTLRLPGFLELDRVRSYGDTVVMQLVVDEPRASTSGCSGRQEGR